MMLCLHIHMIFVQRNLKLSCKTHKPPQEKRKTGNKHHRSITNYVRVVTRAIMTFDSMLPCMYSRQQKLPKALAAKPTHVAHMPHQPNTL